MKLKIASFIFLATSVCQKAYAGPSVALFCHDQENENYIMAYDLDPDRQMYGIYGQYQELSEQFGPVFETEFDVKNYHSEVLSFNSEYVDVRILDQEGNTPDIYLKKTSSHHDRTRSFLGKIKNLRIIRSLDTENSYPLKASLILIIEGAINKQILFEKCQFSGANVHDWAKMWRQP